LSWYFCPFSIRATMPLPSVSRGTRAQVIAASQKLHAH
jgi:hypothetical protein